MDNASKGLKALIQKEINYCESQLKKIFTAYSDSESDLRVVILRVRETQRVRLNQRVRLIQRERVIQISHSILHAT